MSSYRTGQAITHYGRAIVITIVIVGMMSISMNAGVPVGAIVIALILLAIVRGIVRRIRKV